MDVDVFRRDSLGRADRIIGPAIVLEDACTSLVLPGWEAAVSTRGHLILSRVG
jgi:5-oxoprolinase (ATP-hydrolysing)